MHTRKIEAFGVIVTRFPLGNLEKINSCRFLSFGSLESQFYCIPALA